MISTRFNILRLHMLFVIVNFIFLKRYAIFEFRAPAYSLGLSRIRVVFRNICPVEA